MASTRVLASSVPDWFVVCQLDRLKIVGSAHIHGTRWEQRGLALKIDLTFGISVTEAVPGSELPVACSERHVQSDSTFCFGIEKLDPQNESASVDWWRQLEQFIKLQEVASRTGMWPRTHALDHGSAGEWHASCRNIAEKLGLQEEYEAAHSGELSWITNQSLHICRHKDGSPLNGRSYCPRKCFGNRGNRILRVDCPNRELICRLVHHDQIRRIELEKFWDYIRSTNRICCRTMRLCPLNI